MNALRDLIASFKEFMRDYRRRAWRRKRTASIPDPFSNLNRNPK